MTAQRPASAAVLSALLVVGVGYLFFFAGGYFGIYSVQVRVSSLLIAGAILVAWLVVAIRTPRWAPTSALWPALSIGLAALAITTLFSRNPRISLDFLAYGVLLACLYLLLRSLLTVQELRARLGATIVILAVALDIAYLAAVVGRWQTWWDLVGRMATPPLRPFYEALTYGNPGLVAALAVVATIAATAHLSSSGRAGRVVAIVLWGLTLAVVVASGTRGAWLALGVTAVCAAGIGLARPEWRSRVRDGIGSRAGMVVWAVSIVVLAGVAIVVLPIVVDRIVGSGEGGRTAYWAAAIRMFQASPVTGVGPGMWAPERILHTAPGELDYYIPHAHNLVLQTMAEMGLVGLAAGAAVIVIVARLVARAARGEDPAARRWAVAAILATVYVGIHQMFDLYVSMPAALFAYAFPIAWLDAQASGSRAVAVPGWQDRAPRGVAAVMLGAVIASLAWGAIGERSALVLDGAKSAFDAGDWAAADRLAAEAVAIDPSMPPNQVLLGLAAARAGDTARARSAIEAVVDADDLPPAWIDLAWLQAGQGDRTGARASLERGLRLGGQQPAIALAAGYVYEQLGDTDQADRLYADTLAAYPRLAADGYWTDPARVDRWPAIEQDVLGRLEAPARVELLLALDDSDRAREAAATLDDAATADTLRTVIAAWDGDPAARARLEAAARSSPDDAYLLGWCARIAARQGDGAAARAFRYWADTGGLEAGQAGLEVVVGTGSDAPTTMAGAAWVPYGLYTYRRPTPVGLLLPGLPTLEWSDEPQVRAAS